MMLRGEVLGVVLFCFAYCDFRLFRIEQLKIHYNYNHFSCGVLNEH